MSYTNSEQIFMDVLGGRSPSPSEQKQIDQLLAILTRAGFVVDDPSNAAHVTLLAWGWARETGRGDVLAALHSHNRAIEEKLGGFQQAVEQRMDALFLDLKNSPQPAPSLDAHSVAAAIASAMPQPVTSIKIDTSILKDAILESVSKLWLIMAGVGLVACFWAGMEWKQHQSQQILGQLLRQNTQLQAQNEQLVKALASHHAH